MSAPDLTPKTVFFPYEKRGPEIPDSHPYQRWFNLRPTDVGWPPGISVYRSGHSDFAQLDLGERSGKLRVLAGIDLTAEECRAVAELLLNAAQDLDDHPASTLQAKRDVKEVVPWD